MICKHWKKKPSEFIDEPKCAFNVDGSFNTDNWNCALMNKLRDLAELNEVWNDDDYCSIIPIPDYGWAILKWYKHRGKTDLFFVLEGGKDICRQGTESDIKKILNMKSYEVGVDEE